MAWNSTFAFFITDSFFLSLLDSSKHKLHHSFSLLFSLIYDWQSESCHKWSSISSLHLMMVFPLMDLFANPLLKVLRKFLVVTFWMKSLVKILLWTVDKMMSTSTIACDNKMWPLTLDKLLKEQSSFREKKNFLKISLSSFSNEFCERWSRLVKLTIDKWEMDDFYLKYLGKHSTE